MVVVSCGSFACRALLLNTPKVLVTPASAPPVTLLCCVYLKSARQVPTAAIVTAAIAATDRNLTMSPDSQRLSSFDVCHPEAPFSAPKDLCICRHHHKRGDLLIPFTSKVHLPRRQYRLGTPSINLLRCPHPGAVLHTLARNLRQHMLKRAQDTDGIEIVVIPNVSDAEQLPLHLALPIGDHGIERLAKLLHDLAGIDSLRRTDRRQRRRRSGSIKLQPESLRARARHLRTLLRVVDQLDASRCQIAFAHAANSEVAGV